MTTRVDTLQEHEGRRSVAQVMDADASYAGLIT